MRGGDTVFDGTCQRCTRLADYLRETGERYPEYHCAPVSPFGDPRARLLIVGLAPGLHGANASGRPFTGDHAGILLYRTLHRFGFSSSAESHGPDDGLTLSDCRITNAVKCVPPQNKPKAAEISNCNTYLAAELKTLGKDAVLLALGRIAHEAIARALDEPLSRFRFAHNAEHRLAGHDLWLIDSYHCSRYNTQTGRLTEAMFDEVFARARARLGRRAA